MFESLSGEEVGDGTFLTLLVVASKADELLSFLESLSGEEVGDGTFLTLLAVASKVDELSTALIISLLETLLLDEELVDVGLTMLVVLCSFCCCCELLLTGDGSFLFADLSTWPLDLVVFLGLIGV